MYMSVHPYGQDSPFHPQRDVSQNGETDCRKKHQVFVKYFNGFATRIFVTMISLLVAADISQPTASDR
jgi:heme/copper-type cytochrome/quinol oxidase subunit 4